MHNTDEYSNGLLVERTQLLDSSTRWNLFHMHSRGSGSASLYELGYSASQGITYTLQERREANCDLATWRLIDQKLLTNIFFSKVLLPWEDSNQRNGRKKSKQESFGSIFCLKKKKFFYHIWHILTFTARRRFNGTRSQSSDFQTSRPFPSGTVGN